MNNGGFCALLADRVLMLHVSGVNVGQNGDPKDSVRFGHVWGPNGGKPVLHRCRSSALYSGHVEGYTCLIVIQRNVTEWMQAAECKKKSVQSLCSSGISAKSSGPSRPVLEMCPTVCANPVLNSSRAVIQSLF